MSDTPAATGTAATVRVAVDAMGGDHAPKAIVAGALGAVEDGKDAGGLEVVLVGDADVLANLLPDPRPAGVRVVEGGASSIDTACTLVADGDADVVLSAGSTGGVVLAATRRLRRLPGVLRPAIAVMLPTSPPVILLDGGAVTDVSAEMLVQFAVMGDRYARALLGVADPTVGLLNIGSEPGKGNALARAAYEALQRAPVRFHGNVEGGDLIHPSVDVVVTDGFTGNVTLKLFEAALGLDPASERTDIDSTAALLGLEKPVLVAHGAARAGSITTGCRLARRLVADDVIGSVRRQLIE